MKNILVLGGTGTIGSHMVKELAAQGNNVTVTSRSKNKVSQKNINFVHCNAKEEQSLIMLLKSKWDVIVDFLVHSNDSFNRLAPKILAATNQYIFLSSARVYSDSNGKIVESSTRLLESSVDLQFLNSDDYSLSKARQENVLFESEYSNWTIVRPYITYGEQRFQLGVLEKEEWLYRALKGRTIIFSEDMASKLTTLTYGLDVANTIANLISKQTCFGEIYNIAHNHSISWQIVLNIYLDILECKLGSRPKFMLLDLKDFSICKKEAYQIKYDRLYDRCFDGEKVEKIVDLNSFISVSKGLEKCLTEFLKNPQFLAIYWGSEAVKDRFSGQHASLWEMPNWKKRVKYLITRYVMLN